MNHRRIIFAATRIYLAIALLGTMLQVTSLPGIAATQIDILGPAGSAEFGLSVTMLINGNFVVADPGFSSGSVTSVGAVYLYNGSSGSLISVLTGTLTNDQVGSGGVTALSNGNYLVSSPSWDNGILTDAGAVTWGSGTSGVSGEISITNSLVGSLVNDQVGSGGVTVLNNGNYLVRSPDWDNVGIVDAGAVTWGMD